MEDQFEQLPILDTQEPDDDELSTVAAHLKATDPDGQRIARILRNTYDMLLDGQHTGRFRWEHLNKTEKTHFGTLVEINLRREFRFADGEAMDFSISGIDVDCKFAQVLGEWMIPPEAVGHLLLGLWAKDQEGRWSAGLIRARREILTDPKGNRDRKMRLTAAGKAQVSWLFLKHPLPENALLHIPKEQLDKIFDCSPYGTRRIDMLFRLAQRRLISRNVVATVAQQDDFMKRVRGNGGSRSTLRPEGIVILGQYRSHCAIAQTLGLPVPSRGESVSVRLARRRVEHNGLPFVVLDSEEWVVARPTDPPEQAPILPKV